MTELQREHNEADARDYAHGEFMESKGKERCSICEQYFFDLVRGLCSNCAPRCHEEFCDGLLMLQMADLAICDKCGGTYLLNEKGNWILKDN